MDMVAFNQGLMIMGLGMGGVFITLIIFYFLILFFNKVIKSKPEEE